MYQISFGYFQIDNNDYLTIGYGWNPKNTSASIISYGSSNNGYPPDIFATASNIFVEFDAGTFSTAPGFELSLVVRNISGIFYLTMKQFF